ncbi:exopolyphosphatase [uncultured Jatrophihabitans sp.]|uniref:Ppx/GppA phosphatase family protein n=1 Tax=uncultured Jatrophihabitans sp. TaxID=1610747 RepID=UPI0035C94A84
MTPVAAIDCGTNSIRLLIAEPEGGGLRDVTREMRIVRLGEGVDRTGRFAPAALERTRAAVREYAATIERSGARRVRMVATSATRDAANRADFVAMVHAELGVEPEVITGLEEAALSFTGAASVLPQSRGPLLVADIGGGSTELVRGDLADAAAADRTLQSHSMDVGCVRMTERYLHDDPPTPAQAAAVVADVQSALDAAAVDVALEPDVPLVGVAGTVTTIAALVLGLPRYDSARIHGARISAEQVSDVTQSLLAMTRDQRAALPVMHPGRADVIGGGALVLRTVVERTGVTAVTASEHDILDGIALGLT